MFGKYIRLIRCRSADSRPVHIYQGNKFWITDLCVGINPNCVSWNIAPLGIDLQVPDCPDLFFSFPQNGAEKVPHTIFSCVPYFHSTQRIEMKQASREETTTQDRVPDSCCIFRGGEIPQKAVSAYLRMCRTPRNKLDCLLAPCCVRTKWKSWTRKNFSPQAEAQQIQTKKHLPENNLAI